MFGVALPKKICVVATVCFAAVFVCFPVCATSTEEENEGIKQVLEDGGKQYALVKIVIHTLTSGVPAKTDVNKHKREYLCRLEWLLRHADQEEKPATPEEDRLKACEYSADEFPVELTGGFEDKKFNAELAALIRAYKAEVPEGQLLEDNDTAFSLSSIALDEAAASVLIERVKKPLEKLVAVYDRTPLQMPPGKTVFNFSDKEEKEKKEDKEEKEKKEEAVTAKEVAPKTLKEIWREMKTVISNNYNEKIYGEVKNKILEKEVNAEDVVKILKLTTSPVVLNGNTEKVSIEVSGELVLFPLRKPTLEARLSFSTEYLRKGDDDDPENKVLIDAGVFRHHLLSEEADSLTEELRRTQVYWGPLFRYYRDFKQAFRSISAGVGGGTFLRPADRLQLEAGLALTYNINDIVEQDEMFAPPELENGLGGLVRLGARLGFVNNWLIIQRLDVYKPVFSEDNSFYFYGTGLELPISTLSDNLKFTIKPSYNLIYQTNPPLETTGKRDDTYSLEFEIKWGK